MECCNKHASLSSFFLRLNNTLKIMCLYTPMSAGAYGAQKRTVAPAMPPDTGMRKQTLVPCKSGKRYEPLSHLSSPFMAFL